MWVVEDAAKREATAADLPAQPKVHLRGVTMRFSSARGAEGVALADLSLGVADKSFVSLVGRSGCGKTTLLNLVAGILRPTAGSVLVDGVPVREPGPDRGIVFQDAALFPWLTASGNIEFGLRHLGVGKAERKSRGRELIELVRLEGFADKYPHELSGGMRQRVAIARAIATDPDVLLMDEPFGALDELTRSDMQEELLRIWQQRRKTVLFITHSISEAVYLSDVVHVIGDHKVRSTHHIASDRPRRRDSVEFLRDVEEVHRAIG